jgi:site-specific recombinase XerC
LDLTVQGASAASAGAPRTLRQKITRGVGWGVKMSTFTKQFSSADDYEDWLRVVGQRVHVLTISNSSPVRNLSAPRTSVYTPRKEPAVVVVKYETKDRSLAPQKGKLSTLIQIVAIGAVFWVLFIYAIKMLM